MRVTDDHVGMLRAVLAEDIGEYERIADRLESIGELAGYNFLLAGAFYEAVRRRFANGYTLPEVIRFVAQERIRFDDPETDMNPLVAERLILSALGDGSAEGLDERSKAEAQLLLLLALVVDQDLDDVGLDDFLEEARKVADASIERSY